MVVLSQYGEFCCCLSRYGFYCDNMENSAVTLWILLSYYTEVFTLWYGEFNCRIVVFSTVSVRWIQLSHCGEFCYFSIVYSAAPIMLCYDELCHLSMVNAVLELWWILLGHYVEFYCHIMMNSIVSVCFLFNVSLCWILLSCHGEFYSAMLNSAVWFYSLNMVNSAVALRWILLSF